MALLDTRQMIPYNAPSAGGAALFTPVLRNTRFITRQDELIPLHGPLGAPMWSLLPTDPNHAATT